MSKTFKCRHCHRWCKRNPRIKGVQKYCGSRECQNVRKKKWDRYQRLKNPDYRKRRRTSNQRWRDKYPGHKYQEEYRESHPDYCKENRRQQVSRNQNRQTPAIPPKIVKTDALTSESVALQGLYVLLPYKKAVKKTDTKKIVKTDALIVQIVAGTGFTGGLFPNSS